MMGLPFVWYALGHPPVPVMALVFTLILPIVGAALFSVATIRGLRYVMLLRYGELSPAHIISSHATNTSVNSRRVMRYNYEFEGRDGERHAGSSATVSRERIGDEDTEHVLFLPSNPRVSVLVDALPLRFGLELGDAGELMSYEGLRSVVWYGLAWAGIIAHLAYGVGCWLGVL